MPRAYLHRLIFQWLSNPVAAIPTETLVKSFCFQTLLNLLLKEITLLNPREWLVLWFGQLSYIFINFMKTYLIYKICNFTLQWTSENQSEIWTPRSKIRCLIWVCHLVTLGPEIMDSQLICPIILHSNEVLNLTLPSKVYMFLLSRIYNELKGKGGKYQWISKRKYKIIRNSHILVHKVIHSITGKLESVFPLSHCSKIAYP